jgi:hypothetical protein
MKLNHQISKNLVRLAVAAALVGLATGCYNRETREDKTSSTNTPSAVTSPSSQPSERTSPSANSSPTNNSPSRVPNTNDLPSLAHTNLPSTEATPLYGVWRLQYSVHGIVYQSTLKMEGDSGKMLTSFFNVETNQTETVEQTMRLQPSAKGLLLLGYNPVDANSKTRHPTYSPDNFLFQITPNGKYFQTCDDAGRCSPVEIEYIGSEHN